MLIEPKRGVLWAVKIKRSAAPAPTRGFHSGCADLNPERRLVVYPGAERFPLGDGIEAVPPAALAAELAEFGRRS